MNTPTAMTAFNSQTSSIGKTTSDHADTTTHRQHRPSTVHDDTTTQTISSVYMLHGSFLTTQTDGQIK